MASKLSYAAMIAGTHSGVGKTTWALALMALARQRNLKVQPFKAGPDYIDPSFHSVACNPRKSRNLDLFLLSPAAMRNVFTRNCQDADLALVEGVMGLFDGKARNGDSGSSAEVARRLGLPVFLVVDGSGLATSAAAIVLGFQQFDPRLKLAGVFLNCVNSSGHYQWLKQAIESRTGVPCLGYLPKEASLKIPERHLGLVTAAESRGSLQKIEKAAQELAERINWNQFLKQATFSGDDLFSAPIVEPTNWQSPQGLQCRIGVAYDQAFSFYYEDNFDLLRDHGAELVFFSPLHDEKLPENLDLVYLGGGFPELYAQKLSSNEKMKSEMRAFYDNEGYLYGECGGLIYLTEAFLDERGSRHPLVGLIPGQIRMTPRLQHFGYHELEALEDTFLFLRGQKLRSHEFHYSTWEHEGSVKPLYRVGDRLEGIFSDRLVASYQHLHFGSDPSMVVRLIESCGSKIKPLAP